MVSPGGYSQDIAIRYPIVWKGPLATLLQMGFPEQEWVSKPGFQEGFPNKKGLPTLFGDLMATLML